ncbi:MAG: hypothetical protein ACPL0C_05645 [Candidatus Bathyarchaeales archaeon]
MARKLKSHEWLFFFGFSPDEARYVLEQGLPIPAREPTWRKLFYVRSGLISGERTVGMSLKDLKPIYGSGLSPTVYSKYSWLVYHGLFKEEEVEEKEGNPRSKRKPTPEQIRKAETNIPPELLRLRVKRLAQLVKFLENYPSHGKRRGKSS